jgi:hypothetical protein
MDGTLYIANSTFYDNAASVGGGNLIWQNAILHLTNLTLSHNASSNLYAGAGITHINNSILVNVVNGTRDCNKSAGNIVTSQNTIIERNGSTYFSCGIPISSIDPMLGLLTYNGGTTRTMAISAGSSTLDAGENSLCPINDQRGYNRPVDGDGNHSAICDIGAYELQ